MICYSHSQRDKQLTEYNQKIKIQKEIITMKNTRKKVTAFVLAAVICLSAGAIATTSASAAEIDSHFVQVQNTMPMLRNGIWLSTGANGHFEYIEIHNSVNKMHIVSAENMMGVSG